MVIIVDQVWRFVDDGVQLGITKASAQVVNYVEQDVSISPELRHSNTPKHFYHLTDT